MKCLLSLLTLLFLVTTSHADSAETLLASIARPWQDVPLPPWFEKRIFGFYHFQIVGVIIAVLFGSLFNWIGKRFAKLFSKLQLRSKFPWIHEFFHQIEKPFGILTVTGFWYVCVEILEFQGKPRIIMGTLLQVVLSFGLIALAYKLTGFSVDRFFSRFPQNEEKSALGRQLLPLIRKAIIGFVLSLGILISIQELGFNVISLLAGLGLGGLAIALAAQDTLANFFGSIMIFIDQPFKIGDTVNTGKIEGKIEEIGFRSTRIRTPGDSVVSIPNSLLAKESVDNLTERTYQLYKTEIPLTFQNSSGPINRFCEKLIAQLSAYSEVKKNSVLISTRFEKTSGIEVNISFLFLVQDGPKDAELKQRFFTEIIDTLKAMELQFSNPINRVI